MLKILSQTVTDTVLFIGDDEPISSVVGLNIGLLKKGYVIDSLGAIQPTSMEDGYKNHVGIRARFTKFKGNRNCVTSLFKRANLDSDNNTRLELKITKGMRRNDKAGVEINLAPAETDMRSLLTNNVLGKYTRHVETTEDMCQLPNIGFSTDVSDTDIFPKTDEEIETSKYHIDVLISRLQFFEKNYKQIYPLLMLKRFCGINTSNKHEMSLAEFMKIDKYVDIIDQIGIPTNCARRKFIELCQIFKNNNVLPKFKANNFEFIKQQNRSTLRVEVFGIPVFDEPKFEHFQYFDHPAICFCADFLDKTGHFNPVEAKISREIITRI